MLADLLLIARRARAGAVLAGALLAPALLLAAAPWAAWPAKAGFYEGVLAAEKEDWIAAMTEWLPLAEAGNPGARANVADLYFYGLGTEKDQGAAFRWHALAAEQGVAKSMMFLAAAFASGELAPADSAKALGWAFRARRFGAPEADAVLFGLIQAVANDERIAIERAANAWKPTD